MATIEEIYDETFIQRKEGRPSSGIWQHQFENRVHHHMVGASDVVKHQIVHPLGWVRMYLGQWVGLIFPARWGLEEIAEERHAQEIWAKF